MEKMPLENIAKVCGGQLVLTQHSHQMGITAQTEILGAVNDSRDIKKGYAFFAAPGKKTDGHSFIGQAFEKGAYLVITQKTPKQVEEQFGVSDKKWGAYVVVKDSFQALRDIAGFYRSTLHIPVVGVTGSVGKTSTKEFIASVLSQKFKVLKTEENYNNEIGVPLTLLRIRKEHEAAVIEMGISDFGEMHRLSKMVHPTICVITNIGQCHLENLKDRDGVLKAKAEIFDFMTPDGEVCLNGEDDKLSTLVMVHGKPVHFFGLGSNPLEEIYAADIKAVGLFGSRALLHEKETDAPLEVTVPLPGKHMVINAVAAACVGSLLGVSNEQIIEGIARTETVNGRMRMIALPDYTLIDDCYNANPISMRAAIDLLNEADTEKVAILGDMLELGPESDSIHRAIGEYVGSANIQVIICIGEKAKHIYLGVGSVPFEGQLLYYNSKEDFFQQLAMNRHEIIPGTTTILIKASHGMGFSEIVDFLQQPDNNC